MLAKWCKWWSSNIQSQTNGRLNLDADWFQSLIETGRLLDILSWISISESKLIKDSLLAR